MSKMTAFQNEGLRMAQQKNSYCDSVGCGSFGWFRFDTHYSSDLFGINNELKILHGYLLSSDSLCFLLFAST